MAEGQAGELVIEARTPSITSENVQTLTPEKMNRQWNLLTEVARQDIQINPELRKKLLKFCAESVSETMPKEFADLLSEDDSRAKKLAQRYDFEIGAYLDLPPVPDEEIKPDITYAPRLNDPENVRKNLIALHERGYEKGDALNRHMVLHGITAEEKKMIAQRYRFARDVKILALASEILNQGEIAPNDKGELVLPSGIKMVLDVNGDTDERLDLLSPHLWQRRRQLKDRVHEIEVNGRRYILKEKKTARHTDTKRHGHVDGRLSSEEFAIAKSFQKNGEAEDDGIKLTWEKPVGFVSYPDGFQFAVFEYEGGLIPRNEIAQKLSDQIILHREQFEEDFRLVSKLSQKYKRDPRVLAFENKELLKWLFPFGNPTFQEYAKTKAYRMERKAEFLMKDTITEKGYDNSDFDGYAFKILDRNGKIGLQIIGFDFEYFYPSSQGGIQQRLKSDREWHAREQKVTVLGFGEWAEGIDVTRMEKAAYLAMLEAEGRSY